MPPCRWPFAISIYVFACMHVCVHGDTSHPPDAPRHPPPTCPLPRAAGSQNHQNSISLELIEIVWFCFKIQYLWTFLNSYRLQLITLDIPHPPAPPLRAKETQIGRITITLELIEIFQFCWKILYLWTFLNSYRLQLITPDTPTHLPHPPRAEETQIGRITITLEWIEIIQFCLKICDPWTLLHTYRLGLMCMWGVSYPKWHFYVFHPKKCSCVPLIKKFPIFALDPIRPYLDWALRGFLTS